MRSAKIWDWMGKWVVLAALLAAFTARAAAQQVYGAVIGTVTDTTSAVIPSAPVTVLNQATHEVRHTLTDSHGDYRVPNLEPGPYTVSVESTGAFGGFRQENVPVEVNREVRVNVMLQPAAVKAEVTVTTAAPMLQTETAEVNHEISQSQISELPLTSSEGRSYQALYTLLPGASGVQEQNSAAGNPVRSFSVNMNGMGDMGSITRIDGAVNTYGWLPYLVAYIPPADAIQTVNVVTNSFNAEQGVAGGAAINVIVKSGTNNLHGSVWEYNQLFNTNARGYAITQAQYAQVPKNIFNQYGFSIGGPVYIPKVLKGRDKLFFFDAFERTTRRQLITGTETVPDAKMISGDFSEVPQLLYDPLTPGADPSLASSYVGYGSRVTFMSEYGCNCIPAARQFPGSIKMMQLLQPIAASIGTPTATQISNQMLNDYPGSGTLAYTRTTNDAKVTYNPSDKTSIFGRYALAPFSITDPQGLGAAGGPTFDGGQSGAASGRIQNVGLGVSHVITPKLVVDADAGYTRQVTGAQSLIDLADGDFGLNTLGIPGTNGIGSNYVGQPTLAFCSTNSSNAGGCWTALGNAQGANPFLFRDNQFTADVNVSWTFGRHATKYGFTYYHFDLNHFQPTSGSGISSPRGGFQFQGALTASSPTAYTGYSALADFLLGLPNSNGNNMAIAHPYQLTNPNSLRWTELAGYAQDQWTMTPKLTLNYGIRYEMYPAPYRDHTGVYRLDPSLPQSGNVEVGGVNGRPENSGINMGWGQIVPRLGIAYRVTDRMVIRSGAGIATDPDSLRFLRDSFPIDQAPQFYNGSFNNGTQNDTVAVDSNNNPLPLVVGIPNPAAPDISTGYASLPVSGSTNTAPANYRRGYIESWNLFVEQDLGAQFVANIGYVGTHMVRQLAGYSLNAAPLPDGNTICMANGQYNPSSPYYTHALGSNPCNFAANEIINVEHCATSSNPLCYNTGGITMNQPMFSANYNGLQAQLTRRAGRLAQFGLVYTWSHAFNYDDNGAGSGSGGVAFSYPAYLKQNRATASYDRTNNLQFWWIYHLPFGHDQMWANHGLASAILGGFQLNGQISHVSGAPFSIGSSAAINAPGNTAYADLNGPYRQLGGHNRQPCPNVNGAAQLTCGSTVSGGLPWFDPTDIVNTTEPGYSATQLPGTIVAPHFGNTHRNQFRGPGVTQVNASLFRGFHVWRESEFQVRVEAFNLLNHALLNSPNATVSAAGSNFGYITSFGAPYAPTAGSRTLQFSGRINF
jgi:hypothetical protein